MTAPNPEAIEAAARALCGTPFPDTWEKLGADIQALYRREAEDALSAAAPFMEAQVKAEALSEAAEVFGAGEWVDEFMAVRDDVSAVQATVKWLRTRAATIQGAS